jgi:hypothetical protein
MKTISLKDVMELLYFYIFWFHFKYSLKWRHFLDQAMSWTHFSKDKRRAELGWIYVCCWYFGWPKSQKFIYCGVLFTRTLLRACCNLKIISLRSCQNTWMYFWRRMEILSRLSSIAFQYFEEESSGFIEYYVKIFQEILQKKSEHLQQHILIVRFIRSHEVILYISFLISFLFSYFINYSRGCIGGVSIGRIEWKGFFFFVVIFDCVFTIKIETSSDHLNDK